MKKGIIGLAVVLSLSLLPAYSATPPKPGSVCSKQGITKTYQGKKYTCIKSGKKLVWGKGVTPKKDLPLPIASPSITPLPNQSQTPTPTPSNTVASFEGQKCDRSGNVFVLSSSNFLECRFKKGFNLEWVKRSYEPTQFFTAQSPSNISACKLKDASKLAYPNSGANGFPVVPTHPRTPKEGTINIAILPVDFEEFPGESNLKAVLDFNIKMLKEWVAHYSNGKLKIEVTAAEKWVRSERPASFYDREKGQASQTYDQAKRIITQAYVDLAPSNFDFSKIGQLIVIRPQAENVVNSFVGGDFDFKTRQGIQNFLIWSQPAQRIRPPWPLWIHDLGHTIGLSGHAPGNGWPFNIMATHLGNSYPLSAWDQFILEWLLDSQVYCITKDAISGQQLSISPLEREDRAPKAIMIPLSQYSILVIESHGYEKWVNSEDPETKMRKDLYGVMVYKLDTRFQNDRSNEVVAGLSKSFCEEYYGANRICGSDGKVDQDNGNDLRFPKFAYYLPVDGGRSNDYNFLTGFTPANPVIGDYIAVVGDTFTVDGVRIEFIKTGDFNEIKVSKLG